MELKRKKYFIFCPMWSTLYIYIDMRHWYIPRYISCLGWKYRTIFTVIKIFLLSVAWFWQVRDYVFPFQCLKKLSSIFPFYVYVLLQIMGKCKDLTWTQMNKLCISFLYFDTSIYFLFQFWVITEIGKSREIAVSTF